MTHFADRLLAACSSKGTPLCVGLDPRWDALPVEFRQGADSSRPVQAAAYAAFCRQVIDLVAPLVAVVKPQSAFFEVLGPEGMAALMEVMNHARQRGLVAILDAKRGDVASTADAYAEMAFNTYHADAVTINPYLGRDAIEPFLRLGRQQQRGAFVLVRTSNPGAGEFQDLITHGEPLYRQVGAAVESWTRECLGDEGFGDVGAVVGATHPRELAELRSLMPHTLFLVPGYGAQGGTARDVAAAFTKGRGAIVNSSRGILFPYDPSHPGWRDAIRAAAERAIAELKSVLAST